MIAAEGRDVVLGGVMRCCANLRVLSSFNGPRARDPVPAGGADHAVVAGVLAFSLLLWSSVAAIASSGFVTFQEANSDPKAMSGKDFVKIIDKSLGDKFQDFIVVFGGCFSYDFTKYMQDGKAAKSTKNFAALSSTGPKGCSYAAGTEQGNLFLQGVATGFSPAFSGEPGTVGHALETSQVTVAKKGEKNKTTEQQQNVNKEPQEPKLFPETDKAKNIQLGRSASSYHAILFAGKPTTCADWYDVVTTYDVLIRSNYKAENIVVLFGSGQRAGGTDGTPLLEDKKSALAHKNEVKEEKECPFTGQKDEQDAEGKPKLISIKAATYKNFKEAMEAWGPVSEKSGTEQYFLWTGTHNTGYAQDLLTLATPPQMQQERPVLPGVGPQQPPGEFVAAPPGPPEIPPERKIRLSLIGGGAYLYGIDVNSSSGFYAGNTQGGAVGTLWGGSAFIDVMRVPVPLLGSPMLSIGVVADQTNAQLQFNGSCGGEPCTGTNGSVRETAVIGEFNLAFPLGGGNVYNWYAGGGAVFKKPLGNPTGPGGPGIEGSATAPAVRIGGTLMHNFTDNFAAGVKVGFQWAGSTTYDTTLPGERFRFGRETEMIFAAVATFSIPVPGAPPP